MISKTFALRCIRCFEKFHIKPKMELRERRSLNFTAPLTDREISPKCSFSLVDEVILSSSPSISGALTI